MIENGHGVERPEIKILARLFYANEVVRIRQWSAARTTEERDRARVAGLGSSSGTGLESWK